MKQAIVFTSFGVADAEARAASIDSAYEELKKEFPAYEIRQAYTSNFVRKRMQQQGQKALSLPEALLGLQEEGFEEVYIQPAHLTPGEEYENKILAVLAEFQGRFRKLRAGEPVFFSSEDCIEGLRTVLACFPLAEGEHLVLLGHGSPHRPNPVYLELQERADIAFWPVHIGVVEETDLPNFSMVMARLKHREVRKVLLAPLLLSGGVHVKEDMAGRDASSWKSRLEEQGITVRTCLRGLGTFPVFRRIYVEKARKLLQADGYIKARNCGS